VESRLRGARPRFHVPTRSALARRTRAGGVRRLLLPARRPHARRTARERRAAGRRVCSGGCRGPGRGAPAVADRVLADHRRHPAVHPPADAGARGAGRSRARRRRRVAVEVRARLARAPHLQPRRRRRGGADDREHLAPRSRRLVLVGGHPGAGRTGADPRPGRAGAHREGARHQRVPRGRGRRRCRAHGRRSTSRPACRSRQWTSCGPCCGHRPSSSSAPSCCPSR